MKKFISILLIFSIQVSSAPYVSAQETQESAPSATPILSGSSMSDSVGIPQLDLTTSSPQQSSPLRQTTLSNSTIVHSLAKKDFRVDENVGIQVDNVTADEIQVEVIDSENQEVEDVVIEKREDGGNVDVVVFPPEGQLLPGEYTLKVTDSTGKTYEQDFTWGVLAINTHKSIYLPNEEAKLAIAVLDERGNMVCDASVRLTISHTTEEGQFIDELSTEKGTIAVKPACKVKEMILEPDYEAVYTVSDPGIYRLTLSAKTKNGSYAISDYLTVQESVPFDIERIAATRIYPPEKYPVTMQITANEDFSGMITESVPGDFVVSQPDSGRKIDLIQSVDSVEDDRQIRELIESLHLSMPFDGDYTLSQGFGEHLLDPLQNDLYARFGLHGHDGADFAMPEGTPILATDDGTVIQSKEKGDYGTTIVIQHTWGRSYYGHLSVLGVKLGDIVKKGSQIALSGNTGISTGPHLHFGIKPTENDFNNGYYGKIDPLSFLGLERQSELVDAPYKVLSWFLSMKKGESVRLSYQYNAPLISPQFYTTGPLRFYTNDGEQFVLGDTTEQATEGTLPSVDTSNQDATSSASINLGDLEASSSAQIPTTEQLNSYSLLFKEARSWQIASDAVTIDNNVESSESLYLNQSPTVVFTSDQVGYAFYPDSTSECVYSKTSDGGASWGAAVSIDSTNTDCLRPVVWYDRWTPGDTTGNLIHIMYTDSGNDSAWYAQMDTANSDTISGKIAVEAKTNSFSSSSSLGSITKGRDGKLYLGTHDGGGAGDTSFIVQCSSSCTSAVNWSDAGTLPLNSDDPDDELLLLPVGTGNDIMAIRFENSGTDFDSNIFNGSAWSGWTAIDVSVTDHTTYEGPWGATLDKDTGYIYLAYAADIATLGTDDDIRVAYYNGSSWDTSSTTNVVLNGSDGVRSGMAITGVKIALDENRDDLYVVYTAQTTPGDPPNTTNNIYYRKSVNNGASWETASSAINSAPEDFYGMNINIHSKDRIFATWHVNTTVDLDGGTVVDLATSTTPTLEMSMRHGGWKEFGVDAPFTF